MINRILKPIRIFIITRKIWKDIIEWDVVNWTRAVRYWEIKCKRNFTGKYILDLGARNGGISLYFALHGANVLCTDLDENALKKARQLHQKYHVEKQIEYRVIDATQIPYYNKFDFICFKSVLGGVGQFKGFKAQKQMLHTIYDALKPNGTLLFVENLKSSKIHQYLRRKYRPWGESWYYPSFHEVLDLLVEFHQVEQKTFGFLGCLGQGNKMKSLFAKADQICDHCLCDDNKYIISCVARK